ncbi:MAG: hypothetical protein M9952_04620 [Microthrixaceae bacterium]|nr:hypothetical protein [Microthrixaceae bacterium]
MRAPRTASQASGGLEIAAAGLVMTLLAVIAVLLDRLTMDVVSGILTLLALSVVGAVAVRWVARREGAPDLASLLVMALFAKVVFTLVRYFVITVVYDDVADAGNYVKWGVQFADLLRSGQFPALDGSLTGRTPETERIGFVAGLMILVVGASRYALSFLFSAICFAGQVLAWRAFRRAVPDGDSKRYAMLLFFLPSMLFWPSSIGKDALMIGCIGVVSYGAAQLLGDQVSIGGVITFTVGVAALMAIRPHMALIAVVALAIGATAGSVSGIRQRGASKSALVRLAALVALVAIGSVGVTQLGKFFQDENSGGDTGVRAALEKTQEQTGTGGSEFQPIAATSPVDLPAAVVTVLIRPFPWEVSNVTGLIAAAEGVVFVGLVVAGRRRLLGWARALPRNPYLIYCAAYALVFIVLFSYVGNFGILARQRTQMMPLVLVCLSMRPAPRRPVEVRRVAARWGRNHKVDTGDVALARVGPGGHDLGGVGECQK